MKFQIEKIEPNDINRYNFMLDFNDNILISCWKVVIYIIHFVVEGFSEKL